MIKYALFDLDGTLVDSLPAFFQCYQQFLSRYGYEGNQEEFDNLHYPLHKAISLLKERYHIEGDINNLVNLYRHDINNRYATLQPIDGAITLLNFLKDNHIKMAVVTANNRILCEDWLRYHHLASYFTHIITCNDVTNSKPDPEPYLKAVSLFNDDKSHFLVFEDSYQGVDSARAAGLKTIKITEESSDSNHDSHVTFIKKIRDAIPLIQPMLS